MEDSMDEVGIREENDDTFVIVITIAKLLASCRVLRLRGFRGRHG